MRYEYKTNGTCSRAILFDVEDGKVKNVEFMGGCNGNPLGATVPARCSRGAARTL